MKEDSVMDLPALQEVVIKKSLHLMPRDLADVRLSILKKLASIMFQYDPNEKLIPLCFWNVKCDRVASVVHEHPQILFKVQLNALVLNPAPGIKLVGTVTHVGYDYISLVALKYFHVVIPKTNIRSEFARLTSNDSWQSTTDPFLNIQTGDDVLFEVVGVKASTHHTHGNSNPFELSIEGSLNPPHTGRIILSEDEVAKTCSSSARPESIDTHSSSVKISSSVSSDSPKTKKRKIPKKDLAGGVASSPKKKMKVSENNITSKKADKATSTALLKSSKQSKHGKAKKEQQKKSGTDTAASSPKSSKKRESNTKKQPLLGTASQAAQRSKRSKRSKKDETSSSDENDESEFEELDDDLSDDFLEKDSDEDVEYDDQDDDDEDEDIESESDLSEAVEVDDSDSE